ncbi:MAG TPA: tetratricopeptide repeat protein [Candidatus Obscuribacterales bacterium]
MALSNRQKYVRLILACLICWLAAASIQKSMLISGQSKARNVGAKSAELNQIAQRQREKIRSLEKTYASTNSSNDAHALIDEQMKLAETLWQNQQFAAAQDGLERSLAVLEKIHGGDAPQLVPVLLSLSRVKQDRIDYQGAKKIVERVMAIDSRHAGSDNMLLARDLNNLATLEMLMGMADKDAVSRYDHLSKAIALLDRSQEAVRKSQGAKAAVGYAIYLENRALALREMGFAYDGAQMETEARTAWSKLR